MSALLDAHVRVASLHMLQPQSYTPNPSGAKWVSVAQPNVSMLPSDVPSVRYKPARRLPVGQFDVPSESNETPTSCSGVLVIVALAGEQQRIRSMPLSPKSLFATRYRPVATLPSGHLAQPALSQPEMS